jgi:hypothetical protein
MKTHAVTFLVLSPLAALLGGCTTTRTNLPGSQIHLGDTLRRVQESGADLAKGVQAAAQSGQDLVVAADKAAKPNADGQSRNDFSRATLTYAERLEKARRFREGYLETFAELKDAIEAAKEEGAETSDGIRTEKWHADSVRRLQKRAKVLAQVVANVEERLGELDTSLARAADAELVARTIAIDAELGRIGGRLKTFASSVRETAKDLNRAAAGLIASLDFSEPALAEPVAPRS